MSLSAVQTDRDLFPDVTIIHNPTRMKFSLTPSTYAVIDYVHQALRNSGDTWCAATRRSMSEHLGISREMVFKAIREGLDKGLLKKGEGGALATTRTWEREIIF